MFKRQRRSLRQQSLAYNRNRGRASPGGGDVGEEPWHGESRKGSSPTTSSPPAYPPSCWTVAEPGVRGRHVLASAHSLPAYSTAHRESAAINCVPPMAAPGLFAACLIASVRVGCGFLGQMRSADALLFFHVGDLLIQRAQACINV